MNTTALRLRLLLIAAPFALGCSSTPTSGNAPATSAEGRTWFERYALCVRAADTSSGGRPSTEASSMSCGSGLSPEARESVRDRSRVCSTCSYSFSPYDTEQSRRTHPDACCYLSNEVMIGRPLVIAAGWRRAPLVRDSIGWGA